jgi:hypothetical protein
MLSLYPSKYNNTRLLVEQSLYNTSFDIDDIDEQEQTLKKAISKKVTSMGKELGRNVGDYIYQSLYNAANVHAGGYDEYVEFFNRPSTDMAIKLFSYNDFVGESEIGALARESILEEHEFIKNEHIKKHTLIPMQDNRLWNKYIKNKNIQRNFVHLTEMYDPMNKTIYFAFQATDINKNGRGLNAAALGKYFQNSLIDEVFPYNSTGGKVSKPFLDVYELTRKTMQNTMAKYGDHVNIIFTGHSQGGSLATMAAADEMFKGKNLKTISFSEAVVGDDLFFKGLKENAGINYENHRIQHKNDPITFVGNRKHFDNKTWDISKALSFDIPKGLKTRLMNAKDYVLQTHQESTLFDAFYNIKVGAINDYPVKGDFIGKSKFDTLSKFIYKVENSKAWEYVKFAKIMLEDYGAKGLNMIEKTGNEKLKNIVSSFKKILTKAGMDMESGRVVKNSMTSSIFENIEKKVFKRLRNKAPEIFSEIIEDLDNVGKTLALKMLDEMDEELKEMAQKTVKPTHFDELADLLNRAVKQGFELKPSEIPELKQFEQKLIKQGDLGTKGWGYVKKYTPLIETPKIAVNKPILESTRDFTRKVGADIVNVKKAVNVVIESIDLQDIYTDVDKPSVTLLNDASKKVGWKIQNAVNKHVDKIAEKFKGIIGPTGIKKGIIKGLSESGTELGGKIINQSVAALKKLILKSGKYGAEAAVKVASKMKKLLAKNSPVIGAALEIGFTIADTISDVERIEDEKEFVVWNGQVIFKLYNPNEYEQLKTMQHLYTMEDMNEIIDFDTFVNTWYGRIGTDKIGRVIIDGVYTDDPDFDIVYEKIKLDVRGNGKEYRGESKTLAVLKNVGLAVLNIAMEVASVGSGSDIAPSIAVGVIDEIFEQQRISQKSNGFNQALKFKILSDGYLEIISDIAPKFVKDNRTFEQVKDGIMDYFTTLMNLKSVYNQNKTDSEKKAILKPKRDLLTKFGMTDVDVSAIAKHIDILENAYTSHPDLLVEIMKAAPLSVFTGYQFIGNTVVGGAINLATLGNDAIEANKIYNYAVSDAMDVSKKILLKYFNERKKGNESRRIYSDDFWDRVEDAKFELTNQEDELRYMYDAGFITKAESFLIMVEPYRQLAFQLKIWDVLENPFKSDYRNDPDVKKFVDEYEIEQRAIFVNEKKVSFDAMSQVIAKHTAGFTDETQNPNDESGTVEIADMYYEMNDLILSSKIKLLLQEHGIGTDNFHYKTIVDNLTQYYHGLNPKMFKAKKWKYGLDLQQNVYARGITQQGIDDLLGTTLNLDFMEIEHSIASQYYLMSRVLDVFYDPRSEFRNDPDIIEYYNTNKINMDRDARLAEIELININNAIEKTRVETYNKLALEFNQKLSDLQNEFNTTLTNTHKEYQEILNGLYDKLKEYEDEINRRNREEYETKLKEYEDAVAKEKQQEEQAQENKDNIDAFQKINDNDNSLEGGIKNDVLNEEEQFDHGLPDKENKKDKFNPTGNLLPFTFDNGPPRMLFENGDEKSYIGPKNALSGGIDQGYWTGAIPNASHAPVNIIDNYYMAYHIEAQENEDIARLRFISRLTRALTSETIKPEKDLTEYEIAVYTLEYLHRNQHLFGLEITNEFMKNGLGAIINSQLYEDDRIGGSIKGELPKDFQPSKFKDLSIEKDVKNPLKRAADLALEIGDDAMSAKFRKISFESQSMERVAKEYIDKLRNSLDQGSVNINSQDRLILENSIKVDTLQEQYTKELISILGKQLFEFL